jgi:hypothetical protein
VTPAELINLAGHAFGRGWQRELARACDVGPMTPVIWIRDGIPRHREWQIIEACQARAQYNAKAVNRLANHIKTRLRTAERKKRKADALREAKRPRTSFERARRKGLEQYLAYRKKADAAALGHARIRARKQGLKLKKHPTHLNLVTVADV